MRQQKQIEVNGKQYTLIPMPPRIAAPLEAKGLKLLTPILGAFQNLAGIMAILPKTDEGKVDWSMIGSLDMGKVLSVLDMRDISRAISDALDALAPHELDYLITGCMAYVQTHVDGRGHSTLNTAQLVDMAFEDTDTLYKVLLEVARFNKFRPFALSTTGSATPATAG